MHPVYSAYLKRNAFRIFVSCCLFIGAVVIIGIFQPRALSERPSLSPFAVMPAYPTAFFSAATALSYLAFDQAKLRKFLGELSPEQNARLIAEFRPNKNGEALAADHIILLDKRMVYIPVGGVKLKSNQGQLKVVGKEIGGHDVSQPVSDPAIIQQIRDYVRYSRRSVVVSGGKRV